MNGSLRLLFEQYEEWKVYEVLKEYAMEQFERGLVESPRELIMDPNGDGNLIKVKLPDLDIYKDKESPQ